LFFDHPAYELHICLPYSQSHGTVPAALGTGYWLHTITAVTVHCLGRLSLLRPSGAVN